MTAHAPSRTDTHTRHTTMKHIAPTASMPAEEVIDLASRLPMLDFSDLGEWLRLTSRTLATFHDWKDDAGVRLRNRNPSYVGCTVWSSPVGDVRLDFAVFLADGTHFGGGFMLSEAGSPEDEGRAVRFLVGTLSEVFERNRDFAERTRRFGILCA